MDRQELIDISNFDGEFFYNHAAYYSNLKRDNLTKYINIYLDLEEESNDPDDTTYVLNEVGRKVFKKHFLINPFNLLETIYDIKSDVYKNNIINIIKNIYIKNFEKMDDLYVNWFNNQREIYLIKMMKNTSILLYNQLNKISYFYPEPIPETVKIYRGIKNEYIKERDKTYTSWTLDIEQANRFAKYIFNRFTPKEANIQTILELEVKTSDIDLFIIGEEDEVVIKNVNDRFGDIIRVKKIK